MRGNFTDVLSRITFPGFTFIVQEYAHRPTLQIECKGTCNISGADLTWTSRKWLLSWHMTDGEVVQTAFKAVMTALEHEAREQFTYRGVTVFDPHYDIEKLVALRMQPDALKERTTA